MPEAEGYHGILTLLSQALALMEPGPAKDLVTQAFQETKKQALQSLTSLEIGMDLGRLLSKPDGE